MSAVDVVLWCHYPFPSGFGSPSKVSELNSEVEQQCNKAFSKLPAEFATQLALGHLAKFNICAIQHLGIMFLNRQAQRRETPSGFVAFPLVGRAGGAFGGPRQHGGLGAAGCPSDGHEYAK